VWERPLRNSVSRESGGAKRSFAHRRSQTEFGNESPRQAGRAPFLDCGAMPPLSFLFLSGVARGRRGQRQRKMKAAGQRRSPKKTPARGAEGLNTATERVNKEAPG